MRLFSTSLRVTVLAACLTFAVTANAQAYQCQVPKGPVSAPSILPDGKTRRSEITGYTLSLSWSPEHCRFASAGDAFQCSGRNGRFGLVLHGLWPEGKGRNWPQWCPTSLQPSPTVIRQNLCLTPSAAMIAHEWAKHGSCMTKRPEAYFKTARILWDSLALPDLDRLSRRKDLTAGMIREAFAAAFPAFETDMVGIDLTGRGWLDEIWLCYNTKFRPTRCSKSQLGPPHAAPVKIWRGL
jgi:ribonuclease T2